MARPRKGLNGYVNHPSGFMQRNKTVITVGCKNFIEKTAKPRLIRMLTQIAQGMVDLIDGAFNPWPSKLPHGGNADFPVWYGQMHDATGVAIYNDGAVVKFLPTKKALDSQPQRHNGVNGIIGSQWLERAIDEAKGQCSKGLWIVLFSSVPYAAEINAHGSSWGRGAMYFDRLSDRQLADILFNLEMDPMFEVR